MSADLDRAQQQLERELGYHRPPVRAVAPSEFVDALETLATIRRQGDLGRILGEIGVDRCRRLAVAFSSVEAIEVLLELEAGIP